MTNAVGIRFRQAGKIYTFDSLDFNIDIGEAVIVETIRGKELGFCAKRTTPVDEDKLDYSLKPVIRVASEQDKERYRENVIKASEAYYKCKELIKKHNLPMRLTDVNYTFDNHKLIFYFTADDRIDFRELVKDLAYIYRTRIELRQIGVRDEAKILGGVGPCGRELCCKNWMSEFSNVTIKMAKDQNIALTPSRISGMCGRLLCCLNYEEEFYEEKIREMPKMRARVMTPKGPGTVIYTNAITDEITIQLESEDGSFSQEVFKLSDEIYEAKEGSGKCNCPMKNVTKIDINEELQNAEEEFGEVIDDEYFVESLEDDGIESLEDDDIDTNQRNKKQNQENRHDRKSTDQNKKKFRDNKKKFKDKNSARKSENGDGKPFKKNPKKDKKERGDRKDKNNKPFKKNDNSENRKFNREANGNRRSKRLIDREKRAKKIENEGDDSL